jgi:DNA-binding transcriptional ArsR family regulator
MTRLSPAARTRPPRRHDDGRPAPARRRTARAARLSGLAPAARVRAALQDHAHVERLSRMFRALGDPTRSKLVFALSLGELCVSDLAGALGTTLSATSHQLRILRDLDIVHVRRAGKSQFYSLNEAAFGFCSPRVCQAWKSALAPDSLVRPRERRAEA